jgi:hypothetical protein
VYESVLIGTQEWITSNLKETKYRNLEVIHNLDKPEPNRKKA